MRTVEGVLREAVIENPVINSAFAEPRRHYKFDDDGITNEIVQQRRPSAYFIPVTQPKKKVSSDSAPSGPMTGRARSGWLGWAHARMRALDSEDQFAVVCDDGMPMEQIQCRHLFDLSGMEACCATR
jgi:hypothetical protein